MLRPTRVRHYLNLMQARGFAAAEVLGGSGIDLTRLSDPDYLVHAEQCHVIAANLIRLSGNPGIGLDVGADLKLTDLGILGYAMAASQTFGQATGLWSRYGNSPIGFAYTVQIIDDAGGGCWGIAATAHALDRALLRFYFDETLAAGAKSLGPTLTGLRFEMVEMELPWSAAEAGVDYAQRFACPVRYAAAKARLVVRVPALDTPVRTSDGSLRELSVRHCGLLVQQIGRYGPVSSRLLSVLRGRGGVPKLEEAAVTLQMSPRSLRRHLQAENTSFQRVIDEFRCEMAKEYLSASAIPAKEVAYLLGFSHVNAFRRAFRLWTQQTVGQYQAAHRRAPR